jgi:hypothetical protein
MLTLADISTGNTATADVLFLIAAIVFGLAALISLVPAARALHHDETPAGTAVRRPVLWWTPFLIPAGLCLLSIAWLVL